LRAIATRVLDATVANEQIIVQLEPQRDPLWRMG
jgi:hypothetical protein